MSTRCNIEFYYPNDKSEYGEPAARIYKHGDGYPDTKHGILALLKGLEKRLAGKDAELKKLPHPYDSSKTAADHAGIFGTRLDDPEWAAAEFITMYRTPMGGNIYVSQQLHGDIEYLYRVICRPNKLEVRVFEVRGGYSSQPRAFVEIDPKTKKPLEPEVA